jgi:hypothetical protein
LNIGLATWPIKAQPNERVGVRPGAPRTSVNEHMILPDRGLLDPFLLHVTLLLQRRVDTSRYQVNSRVW